MKQKLLEYLVRECVVMVLEHIPNYRNLSEDETEGAPAPPADGLGTGDQPAIPNDSDNLQMFTASSKGIWFVNPKNVNKPEQKTFSSNDSGNLERELYKFASKIAGPRVKVSLATIQEVMRTKQNPNSLLFLYIGKRNPDDPEDELFLLPAKSFKEAKEASVSPDASADYEKTAIGQEPQTTQDYATAASRGGKTVAPNIDESVKFRKLVRKMVSEILNNR